MTWVLIGSLVIALVGGGGVGVAYAADGASPGQTLYGIDQALEATQMALTFNPTSKAELSLSLAQERISEAQTLASQGASGEAIAQATQRYQFHIQQAAQGLAQVASSGDEAQAQALQGLLDTSLSVHEQILSEVANQVPEEAVPAIQSALEASQTGAGAVEDALEAAPPGQEEAGPPDEVPAGPPDDAGPSGATDVPSDAESEQDRGQETGSDSGAEGFEGRIAGLEARIANVQDHVESGDYEAAQVELEQYENDVDALALELSSMATEEEGRAEALAVLLEEALSRHSEVLAQTPTRCLLRLNLSSMKRSTRPP